MYIYSCISASMWNCFVGFFFNFKMNFLSGHLFTLQDVNFFIYLHKADDWWAVLIFSFLRIAGQTRGSPVSQRAAEHRNRTLWFSDNDNKQLSSARKTQQHFIWLISGSQNPPVSAYNPHLFIKGWWCPEDQTSFNPNEPLSWQSPASCLVGSRLCPVATACQIPMDSSIESDCDCEQETRERDTVSFAHTFGEYSTRWYILDSLAKKRDLFWKALNSLEQRKWTEEKPMSVSDRTLTKQNRCPLKIQWIETWKEGKQDKRN